MPAFFHAKKAELLEGSRANDRSLKRISSGTFYVQISHVNKLKEKKTAQFQSSVTKLITKPAKNSSLT